MRWLLMRMKILLHYQHYLRNTHFYSYFTVYFALRHTNIPLEEPNLANAANPSP